MYSTQCNLNSSTRSHGGYRAPNSAILPPVWMLERMDIWHTTRQRINYNRQGEEKADDACAPWAEVLNWSTSLRTDRARKSVGNVSLLLRQFRSLRLQPQSSCIAVLRASFAYNPRWMLNAFSVCNHCSRRDWLYGLTDQKWNASPGRTRQPTKYPSTCPFGRRNATLLGPWPAKGSGQTSGRWPRVGLGAANRILWQLRLETGGSVFELWEFVVFRPGTVLRRNLGWRNPVRSTEKRCCVEHYSRVRFENAF